MSDVTNKDELTADDAIPFALATAIIAQLIEQKVFTLDQAANVFKRAADTLAALPHDGSTVQREATNLAVATLMGYSTDLLERKASFS